MFENKILSGILKYCTTPNAVYSKLFDMSESPKVDFDTRLLDNIQSHYAAILMINNDLVKAHDDYGTLLHYAAAAGNQIVVQHLISLGSDVDRPGQDGKTPLMVAVSGNDSATVQVLLEANADINVVDNRGRSALQMALGRSYLTARIRSDIFRLFLKKLQTEYSSIDEIIVKLIRSGCTLYDATYIGEIPILESMLKLGFAIDSTNRNKRTALHAAADMKNMQLIKWLVAKGANVEAVDESGSGALYFAADPENKSMMKFLLKNSANPNTKHSQSGRTPLFKIVQARGHDDAKINECVELLLQYGAIPQNSNVDQWTLFDYCLARDGSIRCHYLVAQLAVLERNGDFNAESVMICNQLRYQMDLSNLTSYLESCRRVLDITMFQRLSLFNLLQVHRLQLKTFVRNETFVSKIEATCKKHKLRELHVYYYKTLMKSINKAVDFVKLENAAIVIICEIFGVNESEGYIAARTLVEFLNKHDLEQFCEAFP